MAKKYYAVRTGRNPGIYRTWDQCKKQVMGYPAAQYKGFATEEEAQAFMNSGETRTAGDQAGNKGTKLSADFEPDMSRVPEGAALAFVDGSYDISTHRYGCGAVILTKEGQHTISKAFESNEESSLRNVAGEIMGAVSAIEWAIENNLKSLTIYHDYMGVGMWGRGEWKTNLDMTRWYKEFVENARSSIEINFVKVPAHSGVKYNEMADQLAGKALGIK